MSITSHKLRLGLLAAPVLFTAALPAQTTTPAEEVVKLDAVVVDGTGHDVSRPTTTATRLALSARQTPQSISTIDRLRLDNESIFSVNEALQGVTGIHVSFYDSQRPLYFSRGFQITDFQVDGVPTYSGSTNQEYDTALYERIEILRGATGLLSGAGVPSATINLTRKRAQKNFAFSARATTGSWDYVRGELDVNTPVTKDGRVRARVVAAAQDRDSFRDRYEDKKVAWLATAEADLTQTTTLGVGYQYQDNDPTSPMWGVIPRFAADGSLANLSTSTNFSTNWTEWSRTSSTAFVNLDQKLGEDWQLRTSYNRTEGDTYSLRVYASGFPDLNTGKGLYLLAGIGETEDVRDNIDVYLSGKVEFLGRKHDVVVGWNLNNLESDALTFASITSGTYFWRYDIPDFRTYSGEAPTPTIIKTGAHRVTYTDQNGYYGTFRFRATEKLSTLVGARLSRWSTQTKVYNTAGAYTGATGGYTVRDEVTPYVGAVYDLTRSFSLYASYTDIFRPQNYKDKNDNLLSPVLGKNSEAGIKAELFERRLQATVSVFETKQDNYGVRDMSVPDNSLPDGSSAYIGVDGTTSRGVEVELSGFLRPGWMVSAGYANVNTRRHALDLTYANVPEHLINVSTHYTLPGAWNRLSLGAGMQWQGAAEGYGISHPTLGRVTVEQGSLALFNVFANYRINRHFSANLSVRNAFDKTYWATLDYPNYGEPRSVQVSLRWNY